jgi:hypothetical protein
MTIEEIKKLRDGLSAEISEKIREFESVSKVQISRVGIDRIYFDDGSPSIANVELKIEIED